MEELPLYTDCFTQLLRFLDIPTLFNLRLTSKDWKTAVDPILGLDLSISITEQWKSMKEKFDSLYAHTNNCISITLGRLSISEARSLLSQLRREKLDASYGVFKRDFKTHSSQIARECRDRLMQLLKQRIHENYVENDVERRTIRQDFEEFRKLVALVASRAFSCRLLSLTSYIIEQPRVDCYNPLAGRPLPKTRYVWVFELPPLASSANSATERHAVTSSVSSLGENSYFSITIEDNQWFNEDFVEFELENEFE